MAECPFRQPSETGKGCIYFSEGICKNSQASLYRCPVFIASVSGDKIDTSYTQSRSWDRCPRKWYYEQILGLQMRPPYTSVNMRMGAEIQRRLAGVEKEPTFFSPDEKINVEIVNLYLEIIQEREMFPDGLRWEVQYKRGGFNGIIDVEFSPEVFGELKFSTSPDFYLHNEIAHEQLNGYFYLKTPPYRWGYMMPIRMPSLKDKADEDAEMKLRRIRLDINKRFNFYFPMFKANKTNAPKWGMPISVNEFDLEEFEKNLKWTKFEMKTACQYGYYKKRRANCLTPGPCDFIPLCDGRNINWELYKRREVKGE